MIDKFCFYIDDAFFEEPITIQIIKDFQILFEVSRQLGVKAIYNKSKFKNAIGNIQYDNALPKFKNKVKDFLKDFEGVDSITQSQAKVNITLAKVCNQRINHFSNAKSTWSLINKTLPPRKFNPHYPKHGRRRENGILIPAHSGESQLYCVDRNSQKLLDDAIFDLRKRSNFHINYDEVEKLFILFPNERTADNTFHAYHNNLDKSNNTIPTSIKKYFGK
ncbi:hypothetical protein HHL23_15870 [Chryseobacterium sp. RP-3-3]|uniref:Uncharacterized protein n=1 Tax=Chryseobacterium antibioticum TaxID=2728847 RepID=A0A7Y0APZ3_9FLAO|nr:hypothetical protein [Chryseobacterium antibioticum]NML71269.1 hypothetical protein [Chryseobacterium antibioticum]